MNSPLVSSLLLASGLPQPPNPYSSNFLQGHHHADRPQLRVAQKPSSLARGLGWSLEKLGRGLQNLGQKMRQPLVDLPPLPDAS